MKRRRCCASSPRVPNGSTSGSVCCAPFELVRFLGKQDVEARERTVASADVTLQLDLDRFRHVGRIHLLFERAQAIAQHDDLVKERLDRPRLLLQRWIPWADR